LRLDDRPGADGRDGLVAPAQPDEHRGHEPLELLRARPDRQAGGVAGAVMDHAPGAADTPGQVTRIRIGSLIGQATGRVAKAAGVAGRESAPVNAVIRSNSHGAPSVLPFAA